MSVTIKRAFNILDRTDHLCFRLPTRHDIERTHNVNETLKAHYIDRRTGVLVNEKTGKTNGFTRLQYTGCMLSLTLVYIQLVWSPFIYLPVPSPSSLRAPSRAPSPFRRPCPFQVHLGAAVSRQVRCPPWSP